MKEEDYVEMLAALGFASIQHLRRLDYFSASSSPDTRKVAASLGAESVVLRAAKGT